MVGVGTMAPPLEEWLGELGCEAYSAAALCGAQGGVYSAASTI